MSPTEPVDPLLSKNESGRNAADTFAPSTKHYYQVCFHLDGSSSTRGYMDPSGNERCKFQSLIAVQGSVGTNDTSSGLPILVWIDIHVSGFYS